MGYTGIGLRDGLSLNHLNPASYNSLQAPLSKQFELGIYYEYDQYNTNSLQESRSFGGLTNLSYQFKISRRIGSSIGISPLSSIDYNITTQKDTGLGTEATYQYTGKGTLSQLHWGNAVGITDRWSVGINASYYFGNFIRTETMLADGFPELTYSSESFLRGLGVDAGIQYTQPLGLSTLTIGVVGNPGRSFSGDVEAELVLGEDGDTVSVVLDKTTEYYQPPSIGTGLSMHRGRWILAADVSSKFWNLHPSTFENIAYEQTWRVSTGVLMQPHPRAENNSQLLSFRAGLYLEQNPLSYEGTRYYNWGVTAGLAYPVHDGKSGIHLTYGYHRTGTTANGLISQHSHSIQLDVVFRDVWGYKRRSD
jgi:hypothetical protein